MAVRPLCAPVALLFTGATVLLLGCATVSVVAPEPAAEETIETVLVGMVTRDEVEAAMPDWVEAEIESRPDPDASLRLAAAGRESTVRVFLGTWCSDSKRELARLWRAFDTAGSEPRAAIEYIAVDREKAEPAAKVAGVGLEYVPTFVVLRDGREVGRVVEESPAGIERDLLDLLEGRRSGVISAREDLGAEAAADGAD